MSKCTFSIPFSGSAEQLFQKARTAVERQGGTFSGTAEQGSFTLQVFGTITGSYSMTAQELRILIEDKPMMIPCAAIENALRSQLG